MSDDLVERLRGEVRSNLGEHLGDDSVGETLQADIHAALDLIDHLWADAAIGEWVRTHRPLEWSTQQRVPFTLGYLNAIGDYRDDALAAKVDPS